jgi:hypothetical protein
MMPPGRHRRSWRGRPVIGRAQPAGTQSWVLEAADPAFAKLSAYFDGCRINGTSVSMILPAA